MNSTTFAIDFLNMKRHKLRITLLLLLGFYISICSGQIPTGYYNSATGLTGENLRTALKTIISNGHVKLPYTSTSFDTWDAYQYTDVRPANPTIIWDMYSDRPSSSPAYTVLRPCLVADKRTAYAPLS